MVVIVVVAPAVSPMGTTDDDAAVAAAGVVDFPGGVDARGNGGGVTVAVVAATLVTGRFDGTLDTR